MDTRSRPCYAPTICVWTPGATPGMRVVSNRSFLPAVLVGVIVLAPAAGIGSAPAAQTAASTPAAATPSDSAATVNKYCVTCHNDRAKTGGLTLDSIDIANPSAHPDVWEKAVRKVRVGMMPPQGAPQPDAATRGQLVAFLAGALD